MGKKSRAEKKEFTGIFVPVQILAMQKLSTIEKIIVADIGYLGNGYRLSNTDMSKKFGVSRRTIINAVNRLRSSKLRLIVDVGPNTYHRCLKLNGEISALFDGKKGAKSAPVEQVKRFIKPTPQEVTEYAASIGFDLDGEQFVNHYESKGWMIGKNKMKDWKAAVRTWKTRQKDNGNTSKTRQYSEPVGSFIR